MKLDLLAFGAHPDDVEISAGGTLAKQVALGHKVGIVDLTRGEMGTRGTAEIRDKEAQQAAKELGVDIRENLGFRDGFFKNDEAHQLEVVKMIRKYKPETVLTNAPYDRHPDHGRGAELVKQACFLAGLRRIETTDENGEAQEAYRPQLVLQYIQFQTIEPDVILDVSGYMDKKMNSIRAHASQFYDPNSNEPKTVISSKNFLESIEYRAQDMGRLIGVDHGEGFVSHQNIGVSDLMCLTSVR
jgi:bacillithiol biosynthesis deacetylase BshB1